MDSKKKKTENMVEYMRNYMREYNKTRVCKYNKNIYEYKQCEICGAKYMNNSRTHHMRSKKHKFKEMEKKLNEMKKIIST